MPLDPRIVNLDTSAGLLRVTLSDEPIVRRVLLGNTIIDFDRRDPCRLTGIEVVGVRSFSRLQGKEVVWTCKLPPEAKYDSFGDGFYFNVFPEGAYGLPVISRADGKANVHLCLNGMDEIVGLEVEVERDWHVDDAARPDAWWF